MFGLGKLKLVKELKNKKPQTEWLKFSNPVNSKSNKNKFLNEIIQDNKFVEEDLKIRAMVEEMLKKEFPSGFKNQDTYEYLVDSVVCKLKQKQLKDSTTETEEANIN